MANLKEHNKYLEHLNFRIRQGRIGSSWRHIKQTNNYSGSNLLFIDGKKYKILQKFSNVCQFFLNKKVLFVLMIVLNIHQNNMVTHQKFVNMMKI
jgi:hypothetical protein